MGTVIFFFEASLDHIARLSQTNKMKGRKKGTKKRSKSSKKVRMEGEKEERNWQ